MEAEVNFKILVLTVITILLSTIISFGQTNFIKYADNPVLQGTPGMWDDVIIKRGSVLFEEGQYFMHYIGSDESAFAGMDIGYAYSTDCINWEKDPLNPGFLYNCYGWEQSGFHDMVVLKTNEKWHMWYGTWPLDYPNEYSYGLGYASSTDGKTWSKYGEQLNFGLSETGWDSDFVTEADVIFNGEKYLMYYYGSSSGDSFIFEIGVAESEDGIMWTKDTLNNPVIASGGPDSHKNSTWALDVLYDENNVSAPYQMWFTGWKDPGNAYYRQRIFYAKSDDGKHWVENEEPVLTVEYDRWVMSHIEALEVVCVDSIYHMWLYGYNRNVSGHGVGYYVDSSNVPGYTGVTDETTLPAEYYLAQNYPNPFNPATMIKYSIPKAVNSELSIVNMRIYDVLGKEVATLVNRQQRPGNYEIKWDASGQVSGVYFYTLTAGSFSETRKMVLLR
jgi:predicted GH43/DUF377 family glycosyl hydrolase